MVFRIVHRCAYYPQFDHEHVRQRTQDEWDAYKFCGAVKNATVNGHFHTKNPRIRIEESNVASARKFFGHWMLETIKAHFGTGERLVPVPSKDSWNTELFRSLMMVRESIPQAGPEWTPPMVRYTVQRQSAASGGPRGYEANYPYLMVTPEAGIKRVVLIDDIVTGGGNMLATRRRLIEAGLDVLGAVVVGRTTVSQPDPWQEGVIELGDDDTHLP